jgi:hypothetical protein
MQYIYEEDNHYALVRLGRQGTFKSTTLYYVRAGKGLIHIIILSLTQIIITAYTKALFYARCFTLFAVMPDKNVHFFIYAFSFLV